MYRILLFALVVSFISCKGNNDKVVIGEAPEKQEMVRIMPHNIEVNYTAQTGEKMIAKYYNTDEIMFVKLSQDGQKDIILQQTDAWAKGAEYGDDNRSWRCQGDDCTFKTETGSVKYSQVFE